MEEPPKDIVLTREELFQKVWSKPARELAKELHVSDVAIVKICMKMNVPKPHRGYWQQLNHGRAPQPPSLPELQANNENEVTISAINRHRLNPQSAELSEEISRKLNANDRIFVAPILRNPHPLIRQTRERIEGSRTDQYNWLLKGRDEPCLEIHVSNAMFDRALRIMDALLKAIESRGYSVGIKNEWGTSTHVFFGAMSVGMRLIERNTRSENKGSEEEKKSWSFKRFSFTPSGLLSFEIVESWAKGCRKTWTDSAGKPLEDQLNEILFGLYNAALSAENYRLQLEKEENIRNLAQLAREKVEAEKSAEIERLKKLEEQCELWMKSQNLRAFILSFEESLKKKSGLIDSTSPEAQWLQWAKKHADEIDPIGSGSLDKLIENAKKSH